MEEMVICKTGYGEGISEEGVMGRLIDDAMQMVERLHTLLDNVSERILARQSTESEVVGP